MDYKMDMGGALAVAVKGLNELVTMGLNQWFTTDTASETLFHKDDPDLAEKCLKEYRAQLERVNALVKDKCVEFLLEIRMLVEAEWALAKDQQSAQYNEEIYKNIMGQLPVPASQITEKEVVK